MPKEIHDKFDKAEAVVERTTKLVLKIVTAVVGLIVGIIIALEQLDYHIISDDPAEEAEEYYEPTIEQQQEFIKDQYEQYQKK